MTNEKKPSRDGQATMSAAERHADVRSEAAFFATMPNGFTEAFQAVLDWRGVSQAQLARDAECPVRTIRRLENGETERPQLETVVRLCVALSLRWRLGESLLVRCGWVLRAGVYEDEVLRYVLEHCTDMALAEVRALLQGWGIYLL